MHLGTFVLATDVRRTRSAAVFTAALVFCALLGLALGVHRWSLIALALLSFVAVYLLDHRRRTNAIARGEIVLDGDDLLLRRRDITIHRVPLDDAKIVGRTLRVGPDQWARVQVVVESGDRAIVAKLAVPFKPGAIDVEGPLKHTIVLDREGSRAFDALHEIRKKRAVP
jgi:hypothetical protein